MVERCGSFCCMWSLSLCKPSSKRQRHCVLSGWRLRLAQRAAITKQVSSLVSAFGRLAVAMAMSSQYALSIELYGDILLDIRHIMGCRE